MHKGMNEHMHAVLEAKKIKVILFSSLVSIILLAIDVFDWCNNMGFVFM